MPKLSPQMTHGRIAKWHVGDSSSDSDGDSGRGGRPHVSEYDILLTVDTDSLVEAAYRLDQFAGTVSLLVESQEDAHVAALLAAEGEEVEVGRPIAVLCEDPEDAAAVRAELLLQQQPTGARIQPTASPSTSAPWPPAMAPAQAAAAATVSQDLGTGRADPGQGQGAGRLSRAGRALVAGVGNLYADVDAATGLAAAALVRSAPPPRLLEWQSYLANSSKASSSSSCGCM